MKYKILIPGDEDLLLEFLQWLTPEAKKLWFHYGIEFDKKKIKGILEDFSELKIIGIDTLYPDIAQNYWVPEKKERIVVFGHLYKFTKDSCRLGIISGITGKGYGTRMMRILINFAKASGVKRINLSTFQNNYPALALYKKFDFKIVKEFDDRPRKGYEMTKKILQIKGLKLL